MMLNGRVRDLAKKVLILSAFSSALAILSGCSSSFMVANNETGESSQALPGVRINGKVHGGVYPIQNATVVLMETQSNGVWNSTKGAYVGTAKALYATTSDTRGFFSFPDTGWSCDAGQYVYIEVTGGHTTADTNTNVVQVAVVGDCSTDLGSTAAIDGINVYLSETSTVAAAYALHSFLTMHTGSLSGTASDGTVSLSTSIPLVDITAPANNNAMALNPSLNPSSTSTGAVQVSLASAYNTIGIYSDGSAIPTNGGFDNDGNAYSSSLVGTTLSYAGVPYTLGTPNQSNGVRGSATSVINLPAGSFSTLNFLGAAVNGTQTGQSFTVTYTDNTTTTFTQDLSDWLSSLKQKYTGEYTALTTSYRNKANGTKDTQAFSIYQYSFALNKAKSVKSLTIPNNTNIVILAVTESNLASCGAGTGTALACTASGLAHGFQNAYNLVDQVTFNASQFPSGAARTTLPGNTKALAPREMINTLSNILQECVDSAGGLVTPSYSGYTVGTSRCGDLFYYTTPSSGTANPTSNTLQAAMNMASYPTTNVSQLMALKPRNVFFAPEISNPSSTQPFAFTLSVFYTGTSLGDTFATPTDLALDTQDNLYMVYGSGTSVTLDELTSAGKGVFSTVVSGVATPKSLALDANGFAWITDDTATSGHIAGLYTSNTKSSVTTQGSAYRSIAVPNGLAAGIAFDASNNMFVTRDSSTNATALLYPTSSTYGSYYSYNLGYPLQRATISARGNFYAVGTSGNTSEWVNYNYATCGTGNAPIVSTISSKNGIAMAVNNNVGTTGNYNAFVPSSGAVSTFNGSTASCTAANTTPAGSKAGLSSTSPTGVAMDGNLSVFWIDSATGTIYSLANIGASTDISTATVTSVAPCYYTGGACADNTTASFQGMTIDSSGAMWYLSKGGSYGLVQSFGLAAPTWPLLASENSGVTVQ